MSDQRKDSKADQSSPTSETHVVQCPVIGPVKVHVEGSRSSSEVVILTVHDLGCDHTMYREFIEHPKMSAIRSRTIWVNVDVPGQGQNEPDLPADYQFPTLQQIGEDLVHVLDKLKFKEVICLGEGAGANIIARFAMAHVERVLGICLMHAVGTTAGLFESMKDKVLKWKLDPIKVNQSAESYLVLHRFGGTKFSKTSDKEELKTIVEGYQETLRTRTNARNLKLFVEVFFNRTSLTENIKKLTCPILLVTGQQSIFNGTTRSLHQSIMKECKDKTKVEFIEVAGVANVLEEKPDKLIECFQYFLQGLGVVSSVPMQNVAKPPRGRSMSMQEYDLPLRQRLFSAQLSSTPPIFDAPSSDSVENSTDPNSPANSPVGSPAGGGVVGQQQPQLLSTSN